MRTVFTLRIAPIVQPVPAPIVAWNSCGSFLLERSGAVVRLRRGSLAAHASSTERGYGAGLQIRFVRRRQFGERGGPPMSCPAGQRL